MSKNPQPENKHRPAPQAMEIPVKDLIPTPDNNRFICTPRLDERMRGLVASVKAHGILQPVIARPHPSKTGKYDLRAGSRRLGAAIQAELRTIPVIVREMTDQQALEITVIENLEREDLHPLEEALGVEKLLAAGMDRETVGARLGRPTSWVARRARLTALVDGWRNCALDPDGYASAWTAAHLELIARLPEETQWAALDHFDPDDGYLNTVKDLRSFLGDFMRSLDAMPWKATDELLLPEVGACTECDKHTGAESQQLLFDEDELAGRKGKTGGGKRVDRCLDAKCYERKLAAYLLARKAELGNKHGREPVLLGRVGGGVSGPVKEAFGDRIVDSWKYETVKKSTPGAAPALIVSGCGVGQVEWVKPTGHTSGVTSRSRPKGADGKPVPIPLSDRRKQLQKRRHALVLKRVQDWLNEYSDAEATKRATESQGEVVLLAALFGIDEQTAGDVACTDSSFLADNWKRFDRLCRDTPLTSAKQNLWFGALLLGVCEVWCRDLAPSQYVGGCAMQVADAHRIGEFLGFDVDAIEKRVAEELPEPKSWAKLKADGTPKSNKPKPATPKSKKPSTKKKGTKKKTGRPKKSPAKKKTKKKKAGRREASDSVVHRGSSGEYTYAENMKAPNEKKVKRGAGKKATKKTKGLRLAN